MQKNPIVEDILDKILSLTVFLRLNERTLFFSNHKLLIRGKRL